MRPRHPTPHPPPPRAIAAALEPVLAAHPRLLFAYLFGSAAIGESSALSDIDLAVAVADPERFSLTDRLALHADCCRALGRDDLDLVVVNQTRNLLLREEIVRHGILFWCRDQRAADDFAVATLHAAMDFRHMRRREMGV